MITFELELETKCGNNLNRFHFSTTFVEKWKKKLTWFQPLFCKSQRTHVHVRPIWCLLSIGMNSLKQLNWLKPAVETFGASVRFKPAEPNSYIESDTVDSNRCSYLDPGLKPLVMSVIYVNIFKLKKKCLVFLWLFWW